MPGILRKSEDLIQATAPEWTTAHVVPRGVPRFVDQNLRGIARYFIRIGSFLPNIQPDNRVKTVAAVQARSRQIEVERIVDGVVPGSLVQIDQREIKLVADVLRDTSTITTNENIEADYPSGVTVDLFGEPYVLTGPVTAYGKSSLTITQGPNSLILQARSGGLISNRISFAVNVPTTASSVFSLVVTGLNVVVNVATNGSSVPITTFQQVVDALNGTASCPVSAAVTGTTSNVIAAVTKTYLAGGTETSTIGVRGRFPVLVGDQLWIQSDPTLLLSGTSYTVTAVQGYSMSLSSYNTIVVLDQTVPRDFTTGDTIYLRGFPAYRSNVLNVPPHRRLPHPIGPFVVDYTSGRFTEGQSPVETLSFQTFDGLDATIDGVFPEPTTKNHPVLRVPIHQSAFLFFRRYCGTITYRNDKFVMRNDDRGRCEIWVDLVPAWPAPKTGQADVSWTTRIKFASPTLNHIYYRFEPNDFARTTGNMLVEAGSGQNNESYNVTFTLAVGQQDATRLRIITSGDPNAEIEMDSWNVVGQTVEKFQYGIVAQHVGAFDWQAGSLQVKPYFKTLADLYTQMDVDALDSGTLLL